MRQSNGHANNLRRPNCQSPQRKSSKKKRKFLVKIAKQSIISQLKRQQMSSDLINQSITGLTVKKDEKKPTKYHAIKKCPRSKTSKGRRLRRQEKRAPNIS